MTHKCKDCEQSEPTVQFSVNELGEKNAWCEKCVKEKIEAMVINKSV